MVESGIAKARCLSLQGDEVVLSLMGSGSLIGDLALLSLSLSARWTWWR